MIKPEFTSEQIEMELAALEQSEAVAAPYYLKRELARRRASKRNVGRPVAFDDEKHVKERERQRKIRLG